MDVSLGPWHDNFGAGGTVKSGMASDTILGRFEDKLGGGTVKSSTLVSGFLLQLGKDKTGEAVELITLLLRCEKEEWET